MMQADSFYAAKTLVELLCLAKCASSMNVVVIVGSYCSLLKYHSRSPPTEFFCNTELARGLNPKPLFLFECAYLWSK